MATPEDKVETVVLHRFLVAVGRENPCVLRSDSFLIAYCSKCLVLSVIFYLRNRPGDAAEINVPTPLRGNTLSRRGLPEPTALAVAAPVPDTAPGLFI